MTIIERDPLLPLQAAMYKRLSEDMAIMNESAKVFDRVDEEHYPRIIIGEDRSNPEDTDCYSATDIFFDRPNIHKHSWKGTSQATSRAGKVFTHETQWLYHRWF